MVNNSVPVCISSKFLQLQDENDPLNPLNLETVCNTFTNILKILEILPLLESYFQLSTRCMGMWQNAVVRI